jgi:beta-galactosidase
MKLYLYSILWTYDKSSRSLNRSSSKILSGLKSIILLALFTTSSAAIAQTLVGQNKNVYKPSGYIPLDKDKTWQKDLNGEWKFMLNGPEDEFFNPQFDVSGWSDIKVPGNWELQGFEEPIYKEPREGVGLYRREFTIPDEWNSRKIFIRFEGVLYGFEFWINGKHAGGFESPFNRSEYDITNLVNQSGTNVLAVRVYRRYKGWQFDTHDAWALSGIYRDVLLFSVKEKHLKDLTITTNLNPDLSDAEVQCKVKIDCPESAWANLKITGSLSDPEGRLIKKFESPVESRRDTQSGASISLNVQNPLLWNAETPNLYSLKLSLVEGSDTLHTVIRRTGIRQLSIDGDVLKLNNVSIKLRGVNHHDIHPDAGRALREEQYREDIELMKRANINAVRTSHYPPHPVFLDLCDEYGIYVICEVPFGFGDKNLYDPSYADILMRRADATIARDKNHPSVLTWSVGNENPITPIVVQTADRVKQLDPSRYRLLPGAQINEKKSPMKGENLTEFAEKTKFILHLPESVEILAPHYPYVREVPGRDRVVNLIDLATDKSITRPVICTEYNHSLGSAFEGLAERWNVIEKYERLAGAFIWLWADQGLKRKIGRRKILTDPLDRLTADENGSDICADVWLDSATVLDSHGGFGTDGIVFADRFPQVDYWIARKVYSPVIIPENEFTVHSGIQSVDLEIINRYDFTNLDKLDCAWELLSNGNKIQSGKLIISAPPHGKGKIIFDINLNDELINSENIIRITFTDFNGRNIYERSVRLIPESGETDFRKIVTAGMTPVKLKSLYDGNIISEYQLGNFVLKVHGAKGRIELLKKGSEKTLLEGPFVRVSRTPEMSELRNYPRYNIKFWETALLSDAIVKECKLSEESEGSVVISMKLDFKSLDKDRNNQSILVDMILVVSPSGFIDLDYTLSPLNANGNFLNLGLAFRLMKEMDEMTWIGDGPYNSYPGQTDAAEYGIWNIKPKSVTDPRSRYYDGNRTNVGLAYITGDAGSEICFLNNGYTASLEESNGGEIFLQILLSSGKGKKTGGMLTLLPVEADKIQTVKGGLTIIPVEADRRPEFIEKLSVFDWK